MDSFPRSPKFINGYLLAVLISLELLMSFSFLGYFHVEPISITIAYIPVMVAALSLAASFAVTIYFVQRINYVLEGKGIDLSNTEFMDILHLQIQFLFGILSLTALLILFLIVNRQYNSYRIYESKVDFLTGPLARRPVTPAPRRAWAPAAAVPAFAA